MNIKRQPIQSLYNYLEKNSYPYLSYSEEWNQGSFEINYKGRKFIIGKSNNMDASEEELRGSTFDYYLRVDSTTVYEQPNMKVFFPKKFIELISNILTDLKSKGKIENNVLSVNNPAYKDAFLNRGDEDEDTWEEYGHQSVKRVIDEVKKIKFPIKVYRGVSENYDKNYEGEAENRSWTTDKSVAEKFAGYFGEIVSKIINEKDVDYEATISRRIMHHALNESEINLNDNGITKKYQIEKMKNGGEVLLAPNGKPSNLTPEQYKLVRTPEFKAWFGDWENSPETSSKVIDENGEPKVMYHGTRRKFTEFGKHYSKKYIKQRLEEGRNILYWFIDNMSSASYYGTKYLHAVFLCIKKPIIEEGLSKMPERMMYIQKEKYGADGVVLYYDDSEQINICAVPSSNQIKLADGTNTTFDTNNPDIRYAGGGEVLTAPNGKPSNLTPEQYKLVRTPEFKAWFGDWERAYETGNYDNVSKVIDEETKEPLVVWHGTKEKWWENTYFVFNPQLEGKSTNVVRRKFGASYFTSKKEVAESFGNILIEVFLNFKKPIQIDANYSDIIDVDDKIENIEYDDDIIVRNTNDIRNNNVSKIFSDIYITTKIFGAIKLADGTNTTFDSNNPDIRYADGGELNMGNEIKERLLWIEYLNELIENEKKYAIQTLYFSKATGDEIYQYISFLSPDGNYKKPSVISKLNKTAIGTLSQVNDVYKNFSLDKLGFKIIKIENEKMEKGGGISEQKYFKVIKNTKPIFAVKIAEGEENISGMSELVMDRLTDYGYFLNEISKSDYENFDYSKIDADDITAFLGILEYFNTENYEAKFNAHKIPSREIFTLAMEVRNTYPKLWFKRGSEYGNQAFKDLIKVMKRGYWLDTEQELYKKRKEYIDAHKEDVDLDDVISMLKWMGEVRGGYDYMLNVIQKNA